MGKKEAQWEAAKAALFEKFWLAIERQLGPSAEKYRVEQGDLLINEVEVAVDEEGVANADEPTAEESPTESRQPAKRRTHGSRIALPPELPRVAVVHELPEGPVAALWMAPSKRVSRLLSGLRFYLSSPGELGAVGGSVNALAVSHRARFVERYTRMIGPG